MDRLARALAEQGHLRDGVTHDEAVDVLWLITSFETFDQLYTGRGLSADAAAERLIAMVTRAICA
jgi:hypothetical protein